MDFLVPVPEYTLVELLEADLAARSGFVWDPGSGRYRSLSTGRYVAETTIRNLIDRYTDSYTLPNIDRITQQMIDGDISLSDWQVKMAREIKDSHIVLGQIGRGGKNVTTLSDYGRMGARIKMEYRYLNNFAQDVKLGMSPDEIRARARLYANGAMVSYWDGKNAAMEAAGMFEERRVLHPAEHCVDCIGYASEGWKPIGYFPPPGMNSKCMHNCKCSKEYRKEKQEALL